MLLNLLRMLIILLTNEIITYFSAAHTHTRFFSDKLEKYCEMEKKQADYALTSKGNIFFWVLGKGGCPCL